MKRLTSNTPLTEAEAMNLSLTNLYARLKEYEDTGLEPEEVRPVVLCRDCEHSQDGFICDSPFHGGMTFPDDFCSRGRRRDGGADDENNH